MSLLVIAVLIFLLLETANVLALYFKPTLKQANAIGMFKAWEKSKKDPEIHNLLQYFVYWVAGSKIIFIALLVIVLLYADKVMLKVATVALVLSIASFYLKMYPLIIKMDKNNELDPKGYSITLGRMILAFILALSLAAVFG